MQSVFQGFEEGRKGAEKAKRTQSYHVQYYSCRERAWLKKVFDEELVMGSLARAIEIAAQAHAGQKEKLGDDYILHPLRVMFEMETEREMIVAVLHDVVEDNDAFSLAGLREEGFSEEVLEALDCVTKREGEGYEDFIGRVEKNELAIKVKMADLEDNMRPLRIPVLKDRDLGRLDKYHTAYRRLEAIDFATE